MSAARNRGGSARDILGRGSRQRRPETEEAAGSAAGGATPPSAPPAAADDGGPKGAEKRRATKRITVDLPRDEHKFLRDFAYDNDTDGMRVVRALLMELREDPGLSGRVLGRLGPRER